MRSLEIVVGLPNGGEDPKPNARRDGVASPNQTMVTLGVTVADLERSLSEAVAAGGTITMPATDKGWVTKGQVRDPAGNLPTLIQQ